ncbi:unnamed protein product [Amoebophrya sp. A25]|nr:unnamed protein product [Amoebophrya sp. A25]|eukprot:GSA25T00011474001.1
MPQGSRSARVCYYELLGVAKDCDETALKKSYRKLALQWHPDKASLNGLSNEDATKKFQQIGEAYQCLTDPQERAWYDSHREQILYGTGDDDDETIDPFERSVDLWSFFSSSCYDGYHDNSGGFFQVYEELFRKIDIAEQDYSDDKRLAPAFGKSADKWAEGPGPFYQHWNGFCSQRPFGHADKYNPLNEPNRRYRRMAETENKKLRQAARGEYNQKVRRLVSLVMRRDPRVEEQERQKAAQKREKVADLERKREEEQLLKREARAAALLEEEKRWAENDRIMREKEEEALLNGASFSSSSCSNARLVGEEDLAGSARSTPRGGTADDEEYKPVQYVCEVCRKNFKSENQFKAHCKSKKHLHAVEALMAEEDEWSDLEDEDDVLAKSDKDEDHKQDQEQSGGSSPSRSRTASSRAEDVSPTNSCSPTRSKDKGSPGANFSPKPRTQTADSIGESVVAKSEASSSRSRRKSRTASKTSGSTSESEDDDFLARFANMRTAKAEPKKFDDSSSKSEGSEKETRSGKIEEEMAKEKVPPSSDDEDEETTSAAGCGSVTSGEAAGDKSSGSPGKAEGSNQDDVDVTSKETEVDARTVNPKASVDTDLEADGADPINIDEKDVDEAANPQQTSGKRKRRRAPKTSAPGECAATNRPRPAGSGESLPEANSMPTVFGCSFCRQTFHTKNKLFDHLKRNPTHMAWKQAPGESKKQAAAATATGPSKGAKKNKNK